MAVDSRADWAYEISQETGGKIIWDQTKHPWDTGKRALLDGMDEATHVMVLQDDVILSESLVEVVTEAIQYAGSHPMGLYVSDGPKPRAVMAHNPSPWWAGYGPIWGPAVVIPSEWIPKLIDRGDRKINRSYDIRLWQFFQAEGVDCYYTNPQLVDHRTGHGSLISKGRDRSAPNFGSGVGLDWSVPPARLEGNTLYPKVTLWKGKQKKIVRKGTNSYRTALRGGFTER